MGASLELLQVLPQRGLRILCAHYTTLLEQRDDLLHTGADVTGPDSLPDGKAIAADRIKCIFGIAVLALSTVVRWKAYCQKRPAASCCRCSVHQQPGAW